MSFPNGRGARVARLWNGRDLIAGGRGRYMLDTSLYYDGGNTLREGPQLPETLFLG